RTDDRPPLAGLERDLVAEADRRIVLSEIDPDHESAASYLSDFGHFGDLPEKLAEQADLRLQAKQRVLALEGVQVGKGRRAGERVAGERVTVEERAPLLRAPEEAVMHALRGQRRRERQVAAGQSLAQAEEVGRNALLLAGEHRPGAPEPGRDL